VPTYIALLRGVNVGGKTTVPMADLRRIALDAGYSHVATLLNSGNLVLSSPDDATTVTTRVRSGLQDRLGLDVDTIVVQAEQWDEIVAANPFPAQAAADPAHVVVTCYVRPPGPERVAALDPARYGPEQIRWHGSVSYTWYPVDIGHSKVTPAVLLRELGVAGTARNWSTVVKLQALAHGSR
jgi:uncharacterized protein (DUF1697 family)